MRRVPRRTEEQAHTDTHVPTALTDEVRLPKAREVLQWQLVVKWF